MDEATRQRALDTYRVVDTLPEEAYDDIVRVAALLCEAPTALVSLIDRDRQWLKARTGFALSQTPRDVAFCDHAIRDPGQMMEVEDATADDRFAANPLVTGPDGVRFYAGMPLVTPSGAPIGTVCVLDTKPRVLDERQRQALASLARLAMNLLESHHRERDLTRNLALAGMADTRPDPPAAAIDVPPAARATLAVFELQDHAGVVERAGDRAVERLLHQLDDLIAAPLRFDRGDSLHRSTGSPETIVLVHGDDAAERFEQMRRRVTAFEQENGIRVLSAAATATSADEPLPAVFLRADAALSRAKDDEAERRTAGGS